MSNPQRAATDPRNVSPKVKQAAVWGAVITGALVVAASFLQAVPAEALAQLGPWAGPVGAALATAAAVLAAYAKGDPARAPSLLLGDRGEVYASADDVGAERFVQGEYASNVEPPEAVQVRPAVVSVDELDGPDHLADESDATRAAESEAAAEALAAALAEQVPDEDEPRG